MRIDHRFVFLQATVRHSAWGRAPQPEPIPIIRKECPPCRSPVEKYVTNTLMVLHAMSQKR